MVLWQRLLILIHLQHLAYFFVMFMAIVDLETNVDVYTVLVGRESEKVYGLYTCENIDICGRPLKCFKM